MPSTQKQRRRRHRSASPSSSKTEQTDVAETETGGSRSSTSNENRPSEDKLRHEGLTQRTTGGGNGTKDNQFRKASSPQSTKPRSKSTSPSRLPGKRQSFRHKSPIRGVTPSSLPYHEGPIRRSSLLLVEEVVETSWLLTRLTVKLLWMLRTGSKWMFMAFRLMLFVAALMPAFVQVLNFYLFNSRVTINISYGFMKRQSLDVYRVCKDLKQNPQGKKYPVVVFVSGGAWIIGYKAWGFLMGKVMQDLGVVFVAPDYRNYPQGTISDMTEDLSLCLDWVFNNIHHFGGDPDNVTLIGQSAGAHISSCLVIDQAVKECNGEPISWTTSSLRSFIGISGPYNVFQSIEQFHARGLDRSIQRQIFEDQLDRWSPSLRVNSIKRRDFVDYLPPVILYHGTADASVTWKQSLQFANALEEAGAAVHTKWYEGKTHTDPILEDPMTGDDPLLADILNIIHQYSPEEIGEEFKFKPLCRMAPMPNIQFARWVNPF